MGLRAGSVIFFAGSGTSYPDPNEAFSRKNIGKKFHNRKKNFREFCNLWLFAKVIKIYRNEGCVTRILLFNDQADWKLFSQGQNLQSRTKTYQVPHKGVWKWRWDGEPVLLRDKTKVLDLKSDPDLVHSGSDLLGSPCRLRGWAAGCPAREAQGCRWFPASVAAWWRGSAAAGRRPLSASAPPSSPPARPRNAAAACTVETASGGIQHKVMPTTAPKDQF